MATLTDSELKELKDLLNQQFNQINQRFDQIDRRFEQVDQRFDQIDRQFEQVDQRFEQVDQRFDQIDQRFEKVDQRFEKVDQRFDQIDQRFDQIDQRSLRLEEKVNNLAVGQGKIDQKLESEVKRLDDRLNTFSTAIAQIPALAERVGELKNWRQIALIVLTGFGGAFFGWILKSGKL